MVENPQTWGHAEHIVNRALEQHEAGKRQGVIGLSVVRKITDALRAEGLLNED